LYPHKEKEFWLWINSWAVFLQKPSDLGYSDDGYELPELHVHYHEVDASSGFPTDRDGQMGLFNDAAMSLQAASKEKRSSMPARIEKMMEILQADPENHYILWHDQEAERHAIKKALPQACEVYGSLDLETREHRIIDFSEGRFQYLATKPVLSGSGCNFQRYCHKSIFLGIGFKFNDFIQSIHRIYRFLQTKECHIHLIYSSSERRILEVLEEKWRNHERMVAEMTKLIKQYGLSSTEMESELRRSIGVERVEVVGDYFTAVNNDCVDECKRLDDNSVDLIHTSIPFSNHYEYTPCYDEKTEVLTQRGWLSFENVTHDDHLATINPETLSLEWQQPSEIIWRPYSGKMFHFHSRGVFDLLVTPDHKMLVDSRVGNRKTGRKSKQYKLIPASELSCNFVHRKWRMLSSAKPAGGLEIENIDIPPLARGQRGPVAHEIKNISASDFMMLAGWYLSEGSCDPILNTYSRHAGRISISQSKDINPENVREIKDLFRRIGLSPRCEGRNIVVHNKPLAAFLCDQFGKGSHEKRIPRWVKDLDARRLLPLLRDTMMKGDGNASGMAYTSYSTQLRDDFQEICLLTGWRASICGAVVRISQNRDDPEIRDRPIEYHYNGMIGCATVPNHTLFVRRNGKAIVSGNSYNDFGHTDGNAHFWKQMDFLTPELWRILKPGRIYACHVKDRVLFGNVTGKGAPTISPFHAEAIFHCQQHGFDYMGMITVVTDVVRENNQTYRLGWSEQCKDGTRMGCGSPEYIVLMRKPQTDRSRGYADVPVQKDKSEYTRARWQVDAHAFWRSSGDRQLRADEMAGYSAETLYRAFRDYNAKNLYDYDFHIRLGERLDAKGSLPATFMSLAPVSHHPDVWADVNRMRTLNGEQTRRKQNNHICPLQFDIVDRIITRYSNPGELVFDPFAGLMTVPLRAMKLERRGYGVELNPDYFTDGVKYLKIEEQDLNAPTLFDFEKAAVGA
jgi:DNA modification methylase